MNFTRLFRKSIMLIALLPCLSVLNAYSPDPSIIARYEERGGMDRGFNERGGMGNPRTDQNARSFEHGYQAGNQHGENQNENNQNEPQIYVEPLNTLDDSTPTQNQQ